MDGDLRGADHPIPMSVALERRLSLDHGDAALSMILAGGEAATARASESPAATSGSEGSSPTLASPGHTHQLSWESEISSIIHVPPMTPTSGPSSLPAFKFPPTPPSPPKSIFVDDLMRADL